MAELFPKNDDKENQDIIENFKKTFQEQGNVEAREVFVITDTIQCQTCYHYESLETLIAHLDRQIQEQLMKSRNKFSKTTHDERISFREWRNPKEKPLVAAKAPNWCHKARGNLKSAKKKRRKRTFLIDIWKMDVIEYMFSQKATEETEK